MANPIYERMMATGSIAPNYSGVTPQFMNPMQKMQYIMQAMTNPAAFVKQAFPDIPQQIQNDPNQILQYLKQTRHISNDQIQSLLNQYPYPRR